jgi:ribokinase
MTKVPEKPTKTAPGRVLVLGSVNRDLVVRVDAHPKPGETIAGSDLVEFPGGKGANQAVAACRAGAETWLFGAIGDDGFGVAMRAFLAGEGIRLDGVRVLPGKSTGIAIITLDQNGENTIVVSPGANAALDAKNADAIDFRQGDWVLAQFEVPEPFITEGFRLARARGAKTILNPAPMKPLDPALLALCDVIVLNQTELASASGADDLTSDAAIEDAALKLAGRTGCIVIVTLGSAGCLAIGGEGKLRVEGRVVTVRDTTGAGDCFVGVLAAMLAEDHGLEAALIHASAAATISVTRDGAADSMPRRAEFMSRTLQI